MSFLAAALALLIERYVGYPKAIYNVIGHPVEWIGKLIGWLDYRFNLEEDTEKESRLAGLLTIGVVCAVVAVPALIIQWVTSHFMFGWIINGLIGTVMLSQKSLRDHVLDVGAAFRQSLSHAQKAVGKIVGRDPKLLDESGVTRAALESLAENTSDGIVAPVFWYCLLGLPGLFIYKAINTADSMIGHKTTRFQHFGWAAAKLDDIVNWPAARISGFLIATAARFNGQENGKARAQAAISAMFRDAKKHSSPNAGWPESAMAGALGLSFGGPRSYDGDTVNLPWLGDGRKSLSRADLSSGIALYDKALIILMLATAVLGTILLLPAVFLQPTI
jgi:adenosylcobinamide-phosphate synthase